jgi:hypothetical protein
MTSMNISLPQDLRESGNMSNSRPGKKPVTVPNYPIVAALSATCFGDDLAHQCQITPVFSPRQGDLLGCFPSQPTAPRARRVARHWAQPVGLTHRIFEHTDTIRQGFMSNTHEKNVGTLGQPFGEKIAERLKEAKLATQ